MWANTAGESCVPNLLSNGNLDLVHAFCGKGAGLLNPHFSPAFVAKRCSWLWMSRTQRFGCGTTEDPAGISPAIRRSQSRKFGPKLRAGPKTPTSHLSRGGLSYQRLPDSDDGKRDLLTRHLQD